MGKARLFRTTRELLQFVGTEICRKISVSYHIDVLQMQLERDPGNWVITDARFPNERKMLKESFGATLIRIKRPGIISINGDHESEKSLGNDDEYDVVFMNEGTIEQLHTEARRYM